MTYEQYWFGDPYMVRAFYEADKLKRLRVDEEAWLNGLYVYQALDATMRNMFRKQGTKSAEYPKKPLGLKHRERKKPDEDAELNYARAYMMNMVMAGKNWKK